jgi:hypothetical protein
VNYRVSWDPDAFRALLRAWNAANQPEAGLSAFDRIEQILSVDAEQQGESRHGDRRILIVPPIGVIFRARTETGEVLILDAWMIARRTT